MQRAFPCHAAARIAMVQQVPANLKHNPACLVVPIVEPVARDANVEVLAVGGAKRPVAGRVGYKLIPISIWRKSQYQSGGNSPSINLEK